MIANIFFKCIKERWKRASNSELIFVKAIIINFFLIDFQQLLFPRRRGVEMRCTVHIFYSPPEGDESSGQNPMGALLQWAPGMYLK